MTKLSKILRIVAAAAFLTALAVNVKVTLTDPFVGMSEEAVAETITDTNNTNDTQQKVKLEVDCFNQFKRGGHDENTVCKIEVNGTEYSCKHVLDLSWSDDVKKCVK